jgi:hypothetical protein
MNGKAQDVVDLIGKIAAARGDDRVGGDGAHVVGQDLGRGVGEREDDGLVGHARDHLGCQDTRTGEAEEQVRAIDHVGQRGGRGALRIFRLLRGHLRLAPVVDQPLQIAQPDVFAPHTQLQEHVEARDPRRAATGGDDLDILERLARDPAAHWSPQRPRRWRSRADRRGRRGCSSAPGKFVQR